MKAFALRLRSSGLWVVMAASSLLAIVLMLRVPPYGVGSWIAVGSSGAQLSLFLSPIAAAAAAWVASSDARAGLDEQLAVAAKTDFRINAVGIGAVTATVVVPYVCGNAVGFARTAGSFPPGIGWWFRYLTLGATTLLLAVAVGWLLGRLLPPIFGVVVAAVVMLALMMFSSIESGLLITSGEPWEGPALGGIVVRVALCLGLLALLAFGDWRRVRSVARHRYQPVVLGVAIVIAVVFVQANAVIGLRELPEQATCVGESVEVCLWPEDQRLVPMVEMFDPRIAALPASLVLPETVLQYGLQRDVVEYDGQVHVQPFGFDISETNPSSYALGMSDEIRNATADTCDTTNDTEWLAMTRIGKWIELRLMEGRPPDYRTSGVPPDILEAWNDAAVITKASDDEQLDWVAEQLTIARCPLPNS